jgi:hypothetical protein
MSYRFPVVKPFTPKPAFECPACHKSIVPVQVAGHIQCPECTTVIESCCEGPIPTFAQRERVDDGVVHGNNRER